MDAYPHTYTVRARAGARGDVETSAAGGKPVLMGAPPPQFGGPGDRWSPEDLLVAAVADCFVLTFRAMARASKLEWNALECGVNGTLDKVDGVSRFTAMAIDARLTVSAGMPVDRAERLLHKAESGCLITSSLSAEVTLQTEILEPQAATAE